MPVWISSRQRSASDSAAAWMNSASIGCTPPSPWIGSIRISPASSNCDVSPGWTNATSEKSGSNGARFAGWPVTASEPSVRPWNEPSSATTFVLPVALRAYLIAASFASVPELQKKACAPGQRAASAAASSSAGSVL